MIMPTYLIIVIIIAVFALMGVQTILTKRKSPFWGIIIPILIIVVGIYFYFFRNLEVSYKNVMVFVIPFIWCLIECYQGRKRRIQEAEKEIKKMKAKDIN